MQSLFVSRMCWEKIIPDQFRGIDDELCLRVRDYAGFLLDLMTCRAFFGVLGVI